MYNYALCNYTTKDKPNFNKHNTSIKYLNMVNNYNKITIVTTENGNSKDNIKTTTNTITL